MKVNIIYYGSERGRGGGGGGHFSESGSLNKTQSLPEGSIATQASFSVGKLYVDHFFKYDTCKISQIPLFLNVIKGAS